MSQVLRSLMGLSKAIAMVAVITIAVGFGRAVAMEHQENSIVGLWQITLKDSGGNFVDSVFSGWTSDGLEFDQDIAPILTGYVCYGTWIRLGGHTYGLTHPFFDFSGATGLSDGTSGYFNYTVTVSNDGKTFTGKENGKFGVPGFNPYAAGGTSFSGFTLSATKIEVDKSLLP